MRVRLLQRAYCAHRLFGFDAWLLLCGQHFANRLYTKMKASFGDKVAREIVHFHYQMAFTSPTQHGITAIMSYARSMLTKAKCPEDLIASAEQVIKGASERWKRCVIW